VVLIEGLSLWFGYVNARIAEPFCGEEGKNERLISSLTPYTPFLLSHQYLNPP
jgi:hypothetical protein